MTDALPTGLDPTDTTLATEKRSVVPTLLGTGMALLLGIGVPAMLLLSMPNSGRSDAWIVHILLTVAVGLRLGLMVSRGRPFLMEFVFWLYVYIFLGLAASVQLITGAMPSTTPQVPASVDLTGAWVIVAGCASFLIGTWFVRRRGAVEAPSTPKSRIGVGRVAILTLIGLAGATFLISRLGFDTFLSNLVVMGRARAELGDDPAFRALVTAIGTIPLLVASHAWIQLRKASRSTRQKPRYGLPIALTTAASLFLVNPLTSPRYLFGTVWGSYLVPLGAYKNRRRVALSLSAFLFAFLFLFPIADAFRRGSSPDLARAGFLEEFMGNGDYDSAAMIGNAVLFVQSEGVTWGNQMLGVLLFWVPRSLWPEKPTDTGILLADYRGYSFTNLSSPLWAEMYINFAWVGVVIGFVALGWLCRKIDTGAERAIREGGLPGVTIAILPLYLLIILRGSLLQATGSLAVLVLSLWLIRSRSRQSSPQNRLSARN